ncbi:hypothetical protein L249_5903 [Ophiocordyceps polyrhachis-furcata BCC 54312]|uniref:Uncharacterized protein n=1 Tax=Ophiocordyceps polyrhachis-furcata BCC 54312 TaxID=1330021 RepID=A0A367KZS7_9HYPO|nr:hypothetical protein L249_5903 [Ophiocordyceps polyrhachis-furcata BCC 54312]
MDSRPPGLGPQPDSASRIQKAVPATDKKAALKARVAAAIGTSKSKGGLNVGLHPALEDLGSWKPQVKIGDSSKTHNFSQPKPASTRGVHNAKPAGTGRLDDNREHSNPYYDETAATPSNGHRGRDPKRLLFNQKGKYIQQAGALRRQADLEAMKKRIAEQTRKAGIEDDLDVEKNFMPETPPDVEWWDEGLLDGRTYAEIGTLSKVKSGTPDSIVTEYIQHPVALEPPQDRHRTPAKPMFLTSKEQAKLRRQRRKAELKELQAKIRLGLIPALPPKVKKGNLMRVLGDVAVKDPTAVEARVNREIEERHQKHIQSNEERRLTKEQKHEKLAKNQQNDATKGIYILVFRITTLVNGQHRYKIGVNAEQLDLTGICIMHPKHNLVIVEGGAWSTNKYKKLMLQRIDWTENSPTRRPENGQNSGRDWLQAESDGLLKDMSSNECKLIFEGEQKARAFRKWGSKICETDTQAREMLARVKMDNFWTLAKNI